MVRGTEKRVIYLRNPDSQLFEEAFFLLREPSELPELKDCDIVEEANRILYEGEAHHAKRSAAFPEEDGKEKWWFFLLGVSSSALGAAVLFLLFL